MAESNGLLEGAIKSVFFSPLLKRGKMEKRGIIQAAGMNHRVQQEDAFLEAKALS